MTAPHVQQSVTPVSFASTTQVWTDIPVPPTVNKVVPPVSTTRVPLLQIPSVAGTIITLPSSQPQEQHADPCRKCGKSTHSMSKCHKRVTCKKCKGKDHGTKFCTIASTPDHKCTFCGKGRHSTENCRARKKAEKEATSGGLPITMNNALNESPLTAGQPQVCLASSPHSGTLLTQTGLPDTSVTHCQ